MFVLVACEESQAVAKAFRERGHIAFSCDIQECSGGRPDIHIKGDVLPLLNGNCIFYTQDGKKHNIAHPWDLIIAHPPCTYLSNAGANSLFKNHKLNVERYKKGLEAKNFFMKFLNTNCKKVCVENPIQSKIYNIPKYTQIIQPYEHGHPFQKKTCLWLIGLPLLKPSNPLPKESAQPTNVAGNWFNKCGSGADRQRARAKTFPGIAKAMAEQWGGNG